MKLVGVEAIRHMCAAALAQENVKLQDLSKFHAFKAYLTDKDREKMEAKTMEVFGSQSYIGKSAKDYKSKKPNRQEKFGAASSSSGPAAGLFD